MNFNKKAFIKGISLVTAALMLAGCAVKEDNTGIDITEKDKNSAFVEQDNQRKIKSDFDVLINSSPKLDSMIGFIDQNISKASKENASYMLVQLEELQKQELPKLEGRYNTGEDIQMEMQKAYMDGFDLSKLEEIKDAVISDLIKETRDNGYKVETAEGFFFPVINYEFYKKYIFYATADIKEYLDIMAVESNKTPVKDAALMIGWDEIIKRALAQEQFLKNYEGSAKEDDVNQLQKKYISFMLFGANNTPLFSYDNKVIDADAKAAYSSAVKENKDSEILQMLGEYLGILSKTDFKFSDEAEKFRNKIIESNTTHNKN